MIRRAISGGIGALLVVATATGCGTATFDNAFEVSVSDPSDRLGTDQVAVALFDPDMGIPEYANEDSERIGVTSPGRPFTTTLFATDTKMVGDSSPPRTVTAGMYLPQLMDDGYYRIQLTPADGQVVEYSAPYVNFNAGYEPVGEKPKTAPALPMRIASVAGDSGWELAVQVIVPSKP